MKRHNRDRRQAMRSHEPERRYGFDRRARVAPAAGDMKFNVKGTAP